MDNFSKADELAKLAGLRDRGLISQKDFERQRKSLLKQPWDWRRPRSLIGICVALVVAIGLVGAVVVAAGRSAPAKVTGKVAFTDTAANLGQVQTAISYAESYVGQNYLSGQCLYFVSLAWKSAGLSIGSSYDPVTYWAGDPMGWTEHSSPRAYNGAPKGALLFWGANPWSSDGHVAIAVDNIGDVVSTSAYPYYHGVHDSPDVLEFNISQRPATTYDYLGWIMPGGTVPTPPAPSPPATSPLATTAPTVTGTASAPAGTNSVQGTGSVAGANGTQGGGSISTPSPTQTAKPPASSSSPAPSSGSAGGGSSSPAPAPTSTSTTATLSPSAPAPPTEPAPPPTWTEYAGGPSHTWTNYTNAGGNEGPTIPANQPIQIACKVPGFAVADGNTWWYRIAQAPWSDQYYVSADAFYNDGASSGSLNGTPFVDPAVANC